MSHLLGNGGLLHPKRTNFHHNAFLHGHRSSINTRYVIRGGTWLLSYEEDNSSESLRLAAGHS